MLFELEVFLNEAVAVNTDVPIEPLLLIGRPIRLDLEDACLLDLRVRHQDLAHSWVLQVLEVRAAKEALRVPTQRDQRPIAYQLLSVRLNFTFVLFTFLFKFRVELLVLSKSQKFRKSLSICFVSCEIFMSFGYRY